MVRVKVVPNEDWKVLKKYFNEGTGVVLVPEPSLEQHFPKAMADAIKEKNDECINYDFGGGDPDFYVDIVTAPMHYAVDALLKTVVDNDG